MSSLDLMPIFGQRYWWLAVVSGVLVLAGVWLVVVGATARRARLADAMGHLAGGHGPESLAVVGTSGEIRGIERLGGWLETRARVPISKNSRQLLALTNRTPSDFLTQKAIFALMGLVAPLLYGLVTNLMGTNSGSTPLGLSLFLGVVAWFVPDLLLRREQTGIRSDAGEALFTYIDLVTLERLANQSSTMALHQAATVSDATLFRHLRSALERARLEQRPAWQALKEVSNDLAMPQLADIADVIRLDEQGASLSGVLRSRVRELRNAHLLEDKLEAQKVSESMTLWMVLPTMVFGLIFLVPPLMRLVGT